MATIDDVIAGLIAFRDTVYSRLDTIDSSIAMIQSTIDNPVMYSHCICPVCQGSGEVSDPVNGEPGPPYQCPRCGGDGNIQFSSINSTSD